MTMKISDIVPTLRTLIGDNPVDSDGVAITLSQQFSDLWIIRHVASFISLKESLDPEGYVMGDKLTSVDADTTITPDLTDRYIILLGDLLKNEILPDYKESIKTPDGAQHIVEPSSIKRSQKDIIQDYVGESVFDPTAFSEAQVVDTLDMGQLYTND